MHLGEKDFAVRCVSVDRCAAVYASGLHVVVWRTEGYTQLTAMVEVPQTFYNRTVGLMGLWSTNRSDDFLMSDGKILPSSDLNPPAEERLHFFGMSCEWTHRKKTPDCGDQCFLMTFLMPRVALQTFPSYSIHRSPSVPPV